MAPEFIASLENFSALSVFVVCLYFVSEKFFSEVKFSGREFLSGEISESIVSNRDEVSVTFKTKHPNGPLFYSGRKKNMVLNLEDGT